jgi:hypothetical protein
VKLRLLLCALASAVAASPASAAPCLLCGQPEASGRTGPATGGEDQPLRIEIAAQLDFSRIAAGTGGGSVEIDPGSGTRRLSGNVRDLGGMALSGEAIITGAPGRGVRIFLPAVIDLESDGGRTARVIDVASDAGPAPRIGPDGTLRVRFAGRLAVSGDADGNYRGRIPISAEYE